MATAVLTAEQERLRLRLCKAASLRFQNGDVLFLWSAAASYRSAIETWRTGRIKTFGDILAGPAKFAETMGGDGDRWRAWAQSNVRRGRDPFPSDALADLVTAATIVWRGAGGEGRGYHRTSCRTDWTGPLVRVVIEIIRSSGLRNAPSGITIKRAIERVAARSEETATIELATDVVREFLEF